MQQQQVQKHQQKSKDKRKEQPLEQLEVKEQK